MIVYFIFSFIYLLIGLYFIYNKIKAFQYFLILSILLPIGSVFRIYFIKFNVYVFEYFYIGVMIYLILYLGSKLKVSKVFIISFFVIILLTLLSLFSLEEKLYILKDFKPFLIFMVAISIMYSMSKNKSTYNLRIINILLFLNAMKYLAIYIVGNYFNLIGAVTEDVFYTINTNFRYSDLGLLFVIYYFIYKIVTKNNFRFTESLYIAIPILISQNRTVMLALVFIVFIYVLFNKSIWYKIAYILLVPISLFALINILGGRLLYLLDFNAILEIVGTRFSPFMIELNSYEFYNYYFGKGIGHPFYIPWFEYRENIKNLNPSIDNLYLTYYMKFGFSFIFIFYGIYYALKTFIKNKTYVIYIFIYFLIVSLTTAFTYQGGFIFLYLIPLFIINNLSLKGVNK